MKTLISLRLDDELLERARVVAAHQKTTVTQLITDALLFRVLEREDAIKTKFYSPRSHPHLRTKRVPLSAKEKKADQSQIWRDTQNCGITER